MAFTIGRVRHEMNETLSIVIPTWNRSQYLLETLEALLPQVMPHKVPIFISDNMSKDDTHEKVVRFQKERYQYVFFGSTPQAVGIDQGMVNAVEMATTEYVWLLSDDDHPEPNAIETILTHLDRKHALVVVNGSTWNHDFSMRVEARRMRVRENREYGPTDQERLLIDTANYITYLGGVVFKRDLWHTVDYRPYIGTDYVHMAIIYRFMPGKRALVVADPLVKIRLGQTNWGHRYFQVEMIHCPSVIWGLPNQFYSSLAKSLVCEKTPQKSLRRMLATRAYGYYDQRVYAQYIDSDPSLPEWWKLVLRIMLWIPQRSFKWAYLGYIGIVSFWRPDDYQLARFRLQCARSGSSAAAPDVQGR